MGIAAWSIITNRQIEQENAGKNRIIHSIEEIIISPESNSSLDRLNEKLNSGNYTVMNIIQNSSKTSVMFS